MRWLNQIYNKVVQVQEKRAAYWMLQSLSDKELKDIGISRGQIREVVDGNVSGTSRC
jgi:uncharacterized protein YjiS (DUF1127 family)